MRLRRKDREPMPVEWTIKDQKVALEWKVNQIFGDRININGKDYSIKFVISENINDIYIKMIYDGEASVSNLNDLFTEVHDKLFDIGYRFYGIREYKDNHEVCVYYVKEGI